MTETKRKIRRKNLIKILIFLVAFLLVIAPFAFNNRLHTVNYRVDSSKLQKDLRLVLIADLHSCAYGENQIELLTCIREQEPDIVLLAGDIVDDQLPLENAEIVLQALGDEFPCFYVSGNHEYWSGHIVEIKEMIRDCGISVLEGNCAEAEIKDQKICICGVDDPTYIGTEKTLQQVRSAASSAPAGNFTILLTHRPELIKSYLQSEFDLIVAGHAHGGQWRLPGIQNGLLSPEQGLFPKYSGGRFDFDKTVFIVSRGLSRESTSVPRIFNPPELVVIDIGPSVEK